MPAQRIAAYLATLTPVPVHRPWPRYPVDGDIWSAIGQEIGQGGGDLMGYWGDADRVHLALRVAGAPCVISTPVAFGAYPSIARHHAPAGRLERSIRDLHGFAAFGMPDRRPWLDHGAWGVRVYHKPFVDWIWGGCFLMALGGLLALSDRRYRSAKTAPGPAFVPARPAPQVAPDSA